MSEALATSEHDDIDRVLGIWFAEKALGAPQIDARMETWFSENPELDARLRYEFGDLISQASEGRLSTWATSARGRLALILLIDQFRRNVYRGSAKAFSHDRLALRLAVEGIVQKMDRELSHIERVFFYMPLQHAESLRVQEKSVQVFNALSAEVSPTLAETFETFAQFAELHCDIIRQFRRFPHRNRILERANTPEEAEYLSEDAPDFGQSV